MGENPWKTGVPRLAHIVSILQGTSMTTHITASSSTGPERSIHARSPRRNASACVRTQPRLGFDEIPISTNPNPGLSEFTADASVSFKISKNAKSITHA